MSISQFYVAMAIPLVGILVNVGVFMTMFLLLSKRMDRLEDRVHSCFDLLIGKMGEMDTRLARLEERLERH
jgi:hypothetical protein